MNKKLERIEIELTSKQAQAWRHLTSERDCSVLFGGAKGGGKSFLLCLWVYYWAKWLIDFFQLPVSNFPLPLGFIGRKRSVDFTKTTLETWKKIIPPEFYEIKEQEKQIIFGNRAKIFFGGLDDERLVNKFNSAEFAFFALDQAEETERNDVSVLQAALRLTYGQKKPPYKSFYTANPAECWLKEDFITNPREDFFYVSALPSENPYLPDNYIETLRKAFAYDEALLNAYLHGDWNALQSSNVLIPSELIERLKGVVVPSQDHNIISCDPSYGGDECVIYVIKDYKIVDKKLLHVKDTMKIVGEIMFLSGKHAINNICVDVIGIGAGIVDRLIELKKNVYAVNSAENAVEKEKFYNKRAEMWWYLMEKVQSKRIPYPEDEELRRQLSSIRYKVINSNGKVQLEPKEETKKRLGRSPDRADAFVYGVYHQQFVSAPEKELSPFWQRVQKDIKPSKEEEYVPL